MNEETPQNGFEKLGLQPAIVQTLKELGYEAPTPIQEQTIPVLLRGRDLIGQAQTGTGKTAAFALPLLHSLDINSRKTQALVLAPTRELAMQVAEAIHTYGRGIGHISVLPVYGGAPIVQQLKRLDRGAQVVVGTPGRIIDHLNRGSLKLDAVRYLVLDEADEMLRMGFIDDVERILSETPADRQTALFSATMPSEIRRIADKHLRDAERVAIEHREVTAPAIEQRFLNVSEGQKMETLTQMLELESSDGVLIFRRTKNGAAELAEKLEARGFAAQAMHGDMTQAMRESVIRRLRNGQIEIVVATDVAARGLDVEQITHVVNYDIPYDAEAYVHRIGRTGRAGRKGMATLFVTPREGRMKREIERFTGTTIQAMKRPSRADLAAKRIAALKQSVTEQIEAGDLDLYLELVEQLVDDGSHDIAEVAAAAVRLANGAKSLAIPPEPEVRTPERTATAPPPRARRQETARASERKGRTGEGPRTKYDQNRVRLSISLGADDGLSASDVVGALANEGGVPGSEIGGIEIGEQKTTVLVPQRLAGTAVDRMQHARYKGRRFDVQLDTPAAGPAEGKSRRTAARSTSGGPSRADRAGERPRLPYERETRGRAGSKATSPKRSSPAKGERDESPRGGKRTAKTSGNPFYAGVSAGKKGGGKKPGRAGGAKPHRKGR